MSQCKSCGGFCRKSGWERDNVTEQAVAWRVEVRKTKPPTEWQLYATYDSEKTAMGMVGRCIGHPLEFRVIPLYALQHNAELSGPQRPARKDEDAQE